MPQYDLTGLSPQDIKVLADALNHYIATVKDDPCTCVLYAQVEWVQGCVAGDHIVPDNVIRRLLCEHLARDHGWRHTAENMPSLTTLLRIHSHVQMED